MPGTESLKNTLSSLGCNVLTMACGGGTLVALVSTGRRVVPHRFSPPVHLKNLNTKTLNYKVMPLDWISQGF